MLWNIFASVPLTTTKQTLPSGIADRMVESQMMRNAKRSKDAGRIRKSMSEIAIPILEVNAAGADSFLRWQP